MKTISKKQFDLQKVHFTEHVIMQLVDQINSRFEKNLFIHWKFLLTYLKYSTLLIMILIFKLKEYGFQEITFNGLEAISLIGNSLLSMAT